MRNLDFSSWRSLLATLLGLILVTVVGVAIRLLTMVAVQQRRERMNRQINERLRTLIAAYRVLGGSFTGDLTVNPVHLREMRRQGVGGDGEEGSAPAPTASERARRIRDAVEAALSDIILLGTEEQVRLAERCARALVAGQPVQTHDLVVSLRDFVREALDLDAVPADLDIPLQGPSRPSGGGGARDKGERAGQEGRSGGMHGGGGGGMGGGGMPGLGTIDDPHAHHGHG